MSSAAGTLGQDQRLRLRREATLLGPATVEGQLYDLGGYPGVLLASGNPVCVHGELMKLDDPQRAFTWLDPYEDVSPGGSPSDLYKRVTTVAVAGNSQFPCWIYALRSAKGHRLLPEGRWLGLVARP